MSILGAMYTAVSGLTAQSSAFDNISDNVSNSQTTGYKEVDTTFADYLTTSTAQVNESGTVEAKPEYENTVQGTISSSTNSLAMAISGQGYFCVSEATGTSSTGTTTFSDQSYYTRDGDFSLNSDGYLVNDQGYYLDVWKASSDGTIDKSSTTALQITQSVYKPVATSTVTMAANLPSNEVSTVEVDSNGNVTAMYDSSGTAVSSMQSETEIYDAEGTAHTLTYSWTPVYSTTANSNGTYDVVSNEWDLSTSMDGEDLGEVQVNFNADGTLEGVGDLTSGAVSSTGTGTATPGSTLAGDAPSYDNSTSSTITFDTGIATTSGSTQKITLDLGTIDGSDGVTQFASSSYTLKTLDQNGVAAGSFSSISVNTSGDIYANYTNGQSRLVAEVPLATFSASDSLQRQNGSAYTATESSGAASLNDESTNGAGSLVTGELESSNVDLATEFTKLIVAQQAYTANTKVVTTANTMLQATIQMIT